LPQAQGNLTPKKFCTFARKKYRITSTGTRIPTDSDVIAEIAEKITVNHQAQDLPLHRPMAIIPVIKATSNTNIPATAPSIGKINVAIAEIAKAANNRINVSIPYRIARKVTPIGLYIAIA
jgi:hypothetical protein